MAKEKKKRFIVFFGEMGSGKDYAAKDFLKNYEDKLKERHGVTIGKLAFADVLRKELQFIMEEKLRGKSIQQIAFEQKATPQEVEELFHIVEDNQLKPKDVYAEEKPNGLREALVYWGTDVRRNQNPNYWTTKWKEAVNKMKERLILVTDARFPNELDVLKNEETLFYYMNAPDVLRVARLILRDGEAFNEKQLSSKTETAITPWVKENQDIVVMGNGHGVMASSEAYLWLLERMGVL